MQLWICEHPYDLINAICCFKILSSIYFRCSHFEMLIIQYIYYLYVEEFVKNHLYYQYSICAVNVYFGLKLALYLILSQINLLTSYWAGKLAWPMGKMTKEQLLLLPSNDSVDLMFCLLWLHQFDEQASCFTFNHSSAMRLYHLVFPKLAMPSCCSLPLAGPPTITWSEQPVTPAFVHTEPGSVETVLPHVPRPRPLLAQMKPG